MSQRKYYAGIGRTRIPDDIEYLLICLGYTYASQGWVLRSSGAKGADISFEKGAIAYATQNNIPLSDVMEIILPFKKLKGRYAGDEGYIFFEDLIQLPATAQKIDDLIRTYYPSHEPLKGNMMRYMRSNALQVLGPELAVPSSFVVCWTQDGDANTRGTGFSKKVAQAYNIPTKDLFYPEIRDELEAFVAAANVPDLSKLKVS